MKTPETREICRLSSFPNLFLGKLFRIGKRRLYLIWCTIWFWDALCVRKIIKRLQTCSKIYATEKKKKFISKKHFQISRLFFIFKTKKLVKLLLSNFFFYYYFEIDLYQFSNSVSSKTCFLYRSTNSEPFNAVFRPAILYLKYLLAQIDKWKKYIERKFCKALCAMIFFKLEYLPICTESVPSCYKYLYECSKKIIYWIESGEFEWIIF